MVTIRSARVTESERRAKLVYLLTLKRVIKIITVIVATAEVLFMIVPLKYSFVNSSSEIWASRLLKKKVNIRRKLTNSFLFVALCLNTSKGLTL
jgi:hypothetical protein